MPIVDASNTEIQVKAPTPVAPLKKPEARSYGAIDIWDAAISTSSPVISMLAENKRDFALDRIESAFFPSVSEREEGFNPYKAAIERGLTDLDAYGGQLSRIGTQRQFDEWLNNFNEMQQAKEVIASTGINGFAASVAAGVIDPINWIPVGAGYSAATRGVNIFRSSLAAARVGLAAGAINEAALTALDASRTVDETGANIAATTLLAGAIGGGIAIWNSARASGMTSFQRADDMAAAFDDDLTMYDSETTNADRRMFGSVNAMLNESKLQGTDGEVINIDTIRKYGGGVKATNKFFSAINKFLPDISAAATLSNSDVPAVRAMGRMLFGESLQQEAGFINPAVTVKNQLAHYEALAVQHLDSIYTKATKFAKANPDYQFNLKQFYEDVYDRAVVGESPAQPAGMSKADTDYAALVDDAAAAQVKYMEKWKSEIDSINIKRKKAALGRMQIEDAGGPDILDTDIALDDIPETADYFLPAKIDREAVLRDIDGFTRKVEDEFRAKRAADLKKKQSKGGELSRDEEIFLRSELDKRVPITGVDEATSNAYAQKIKDDAKYFVDTVIVGNRSGYKDKMFGAGKPASLRERDFFNNQDTMRRFLPYMNKNFNELNWVYARKVGAYIADYKTFGPSGFKGLYQELYGTAGSMDKGYIREQASLLDGAQADRYLKKRGKESDMLMAQYKMLMGDFDTDTSNPMNLTRGQREIIDTVRSFNTVMKMGMSGASSIGEIATSSTAHGVKFWAGSAFPKVLNGAADVFKKSPITERKMIAGALFDAKNRLLYNISNLFESEFAKGEAAKSLNKAASVVYRFSGLTKVNDIAAEIGLDVAVRRLADIQAKKTPTQKDINWLSLIGLEPKDIAGVDFSGDSFGPKVTGALRNAVYSTSLNGSPEYMPAFAGTPIGSMLFQFKGYLFAANRNLLMSGMQRADADVATGALAIIGLSAMSQVIRDGVRLRERKMTAQDVLYGAVSNSGLMGLPGFVIDTLGLPSVLGLRPGIGRYTKENMASQVFGPTVGTLETIGAGSELLQGGNQRERTENARAFVGGIIPVAPLDAPIKDYLVEIIK